MTHASLRQPRHRGRPGPAGPGGPGRARRRRAEHPRDRQEDHRDGRGGAGEEAGDGGHAGLDVHDHQPRPVRQLGLGADHQPAQHRHPLHRRREAPARSRSATRSPSTRPASSAWSTTTARSTGPPRRCSSATSATRWSSGTGRPKSAERRRSSATGHGDDRAHASRPVGRSRVRGLERGADPCRIGVAGLPRRGPAAAGARRRAVARGVPLRQRRRTSPGGRPRPIGPRLLARGRAARARHRIAPRLRPGDLVRAARPHRARAAAVEDVPGVRGRDLPAQHPPDHAVRRLHRRLGAVGTGGARLGARHRAHDLGGHAPMPRACSPRGSTPPRSPS